jgi:hypothetical protein
MKKVKKISLAKKDLTNNEQFINEFLSAKGLSTIKGGYGEWGNEQLGRKFNQCICVKPNGDIQPVDNMDGLWRRFYKNRI